MKNSILTEGAIHSITSVQAADMVACLQQRYIGLSRVSTTQTSYNDTKRQETVDQAHRSVDAFICLDISLSPHEAYS